MKEFRVPCHGARYLSRDKLSPRRKDAIFVRARTKKRAVELLAIVGRHWTPRGIREYGYDTWGNHIIRPEGEAEGVWFTRDFADKHLLPWYVNGKLSAP